jgi:hypothetical protein
LVGNTEVLRNHTADRKHNFNAVCHLIITTLAFHIRTAAFPALLRLSCLLPSLSQLSPPYLSRFPRRAYLQTGPTVARALGELHVVLKEPDSFPSDWTKALRCPEGRSEFSEMPSSVFGQRTCDHASMFNSSKTEHIPSRALRPDNIM